MAVTQAQIAEQLGLNQKTVSVAFGSPGRINDKTRDRILKLAREVGYRPNRLAAGLRGATTRSIGVVWAFVDPWAGDAIIGLDILERCQQRGFVTYQFHQPADTQSLCRHLDELLARRVDAIVIQAIPSQLRDKQVLDRLNAAPAIVAVTREPVPECPGDLIVHDRYDAIREIVDHLVATGKRRLTMALELEQESNPPKYEAFLQRCREHGVADHPHTLISLDYPDRPEKHGRLHLAGFRKAFPEEVPVDAVFCFNDTGALFIARELQDRGLRIPDDVAVVGFNNTEATELMRPPLATGDRKPREVAQLLDDVLARRLESPQAPPARHTVHMAFVWRASAGGRGCGEGVAPSNQLKLNGSKK